MLSHKFCTVLCSVYIHAHQVDGNNIINQVVDTTIIERFLHSLFGPSDVINTAEFQPRFQGFLPFLKIRIAEFL